MDDSNLRWNDNKLNEERSEENLKRFTINFQKILKSTNKRISNVDLRYRDGFAVEIDSKSNQIKNKLWLSKKKKKKLIVALDIGTSKIVTIVSEIKADGDIQILGIGQHVSRGLKKGVVVNIESTMQAIQRSLEEAELMADCKIKEVYTGIAGSPY